jgi:hypothetical protein
MGGQLMDQWTTNWFPVFEPEKFHEAGACWALGGDAEWQEGLFRIFSPPELDGFRPFYEWWNEPDPLEIYWEEKVPAGGGKLTEAFVDEDFRPTAFEFLECFVPAGTPMLLIQESWLPLRDGGRADYSCQGALWLVGDSEDEIVDSGGSPVEVIEEAQKRWPDKEIRPPR